MATTWNSTDKPNRNDNTYTGTTLSSWSRQYKIAVIASLALLGILLALEACSKQASKPAQAGVSNAPQTAAAPAVTPTPTATPTVPAAPAKKTHKKRPAAIVTYRDPETGVSFRYPRKYELASGDKAQPVFADFGTAPTNFVQQGGVAVATVALPKGSYPGTDFSSAFFNVNVNRSLSEQECSQFAFVDTRNPDGEPVDAEKVKVAGQQMEMTSDFSASALKQAEAQYYHRYENGVCYEFVLGLGTAGYGTKDGIEPVDREEVFKQLEKILATVKIQAVENEQVAVKDANASAPTAAPEPQAKQ